MDEILGMGDGFLNFEKAPQNNQDDRYLPRWKVRNRVKFALENGMVIDECETHDLSCSGACLKVDKLLIPGQKLKMKIYLDEKNAIEVAGHVIWNKIADEGRFAGISFDTASANIQQEILNYAFEVNRDELVRHWFSGWEKKLTDRSE